MPKRSSIPAMSLIKSICFAMIMLLVVLCQGCGEKSSSKESYIGQREIVEPEYEPETATGKYTMSEKGAAEPSLLMD